MRFFEGLARHPLDSADADTPAVRLRDTVYDLDAVTEAFVAGANWDLDMLPVVEPPVHTVRAEGRVLADFIIPNEILHGTPPAENSETPERYEEWVEGPSDGPLANLVGGVFTRIDEHTVEISERRREDLVHWSHTTPPETRFYRAVLFLSGWQIEESGAWSLIGKGTYDWLFEVNDDGSAAEGLDLELDGYSTTAILAESREMCEYFGMQLLLPFLCSFALLACKNVSADPASAEGLAPRYLRPVMCPLYSADVGESAVRRWDIEEPSPMPGPGRFAHLDKPDMLPDGLDAGLYWARDAFALGGKHL